MKPSSISFTIIALLVCLSLSNAQQEKKTEKKKSHSPVGTWKWNPDLNGTVVKSVLKIKFNKDKKLVGKYSDQFQNLDIEKASFKDGKLTFQFSTEYENTDVTWKFSGKVGEKAIEGKVIAAFNGEENEFDWKAERAASAVGAWQFEFDAPNGQSYSPILVVKKKDDKFSGVMMTEKDGPSQAVDDVKFEDNVLSFKTKVDVDGAQVALNYKCKIDGNKITGTCEYEVNGDSGEFDVEAKRLKKSDK